MAFRCSGVRVNSASNRLLYIKFALRYIIIKYGNYHGRLIGKALNGLHSNVLLGQITI